APGTSALLRSRKFWSGRKASRAFIAITRLQADLCPPAHARSWHRFGPSLVDWAFWIHQQRDDVLDLIDGEDLVCAEAEHVRACYMRMRIVDPLVDGLDLLLLIVPDLAVVVESRSQCAVAHLLHRQLMAGIAVTTVLPA